MTPIQGSLLLEQGIQRGKEIRPFPSLLPCPLFPVPPKRPSSLLVSFCSPPPLQTLARREKRVRVQVVLALTSAALPCWAFRRPGFMACLTEERVKPFSFSTQEAAPSPAEPPSMHLPTNTNTPPQVFLSLPGCESMKAGLPDRVLPLLIGAAQGTLGGLRPCREVPPQSFTVWPVPSDCRRNGVY